MAESSKKHDKSPENTSDSSIDLILPSTVLSTILSNLDIRSICCAAAACKSLSFAASQTLTFADSFHILDVAIRMDLLRRLLVLPENLHVKSLKLDCARLDDMAIDILARPSLTEVHLHNCENFNGKLISELGNKCHELRSLYVSSLAERRRKVLQFADLDKVLKGCPQLESLSLAFDISRFEDPKFAVNWTVASSKLQSLEIGYIPTSMLTELVDYIILTVDMQVLDDPIKPSTFPSLQKLCLSVDNISDSIVDKISTGLSNLTHLDLKDAPYTEPPLDADLTNNGLQRINPRKKLKHISLTRSQEFLFTHFKRVNDQGVLLMVENCLELESVSLGGFCRVTDAGFRGFAHKCPNLKKLQIFQGSQITDILFHDICQTPLALTHVSLRWCNLLTNSGIKDLSLNKDLVVLDLRDCRKLSDESLKSLSTLSKLESLYLDGTDITNVGVSHLGSGTCPLNSLSLRGCRNLTNACISFLFSGACKATLQSLDLSRVSNITDKAIYKLAQFRVPLLELRLRECPYIGTESVISLASMQLDGGFFGSRLQLLDLYECGGITPIAFKWFKKPYFPRLTWLGVTGSVNRDLVDALNVNRPLLHVSCRGEELKTGYWDSISGWYRYEEDEIDELEQWISEEEEDVLSDGGL